MRIDKFLKVCRLIKRRTVANEACDADRILIGGKPVKPSKEVKVGDVITVVYGNRSLSVRVLEIREVVRKEEASSLYEVIDEN
ncbi:MAG: RNA-binding S4 domain-containing protein [Clostridia bacterium]|nr:RNA-binding S4 domain-containing protein [Clostridia bacterium]